MPLSDLVKAYKAKRREKNVKREVATRMADMVAIMETGGMGNMSSIGAKHYAIIRKLLDKGNSSEAIDYANPAKKVFK